MSTWQQFKKYLISDIKPKYWYYFVGILSIVTLIFISVSFEPFLEKPQHTFPVPGGGSFKITKDYSLYIFTFRAVTESTTTLVSCSVAIVRTSWKKFYATTFFISLNFAAIDFASAAVYGSCYWISCPASANCSIKGHIKPSIFVPSYLTFQAFWVCLLYICTTLSNKEVKSLNVAQNSEQLQLFYFFFGEISTGSQLRGLFFALFSVQILFYMIFIWFVVWFIKGISYYAPYNVTLAGLAIVSKLLLLTITIYGFKRRHPAFLVSALYLLGLCVLLSTVLIVAFFLLTINHHIQGSNNVCSFLFVCIVGYPTEFLSLRSLVLVYKQCKRLVYPVEFSERLLRIPANKIKCEKPLGKGRFGEVWFGKLLFSCATNSLGNQGATQYAAVKRLKATATTEMKCCFFEEAILLSRFDHENVIKSIGLCMDSKPLMLCVEFLEGGSVADYLYKEETRKHLSELDLIEIVLQVSRACVYLESEGFIHRDIAARNCLLSCQTFRGGIAKLKTVKLADFGLAKDVKSRYKNVYQSESMIIPIPYTAPEGLKGGFGPKSDVWSFGVLTWEVFSWGARPFGKCYNNSPNHNCPLCEYTLDEIETLVASEHKTLLDFPDPCTASFIECFTKGFLAKCWQFAANDRPNFVQIRALIEEMKNNCSDNCPCFPFQDLSYESGDNTDLSLTEVPSVYLSEHTYRAYDHEVIPNTSTYYRELHIMRNNYCKNSARQYQEE